MQKFIFLLLAVLVVSGCGKIEKEYQSGRKIQVVFSYQNESKTGTITQSFTDIIKNEGKITHDDIRVFIIDHYQIPEQVTSTLIINNIYNYYQ